MKRNIKLIVTALIVLISLVVISGCKPKNNIEKLKKEVSKETIDERVNEIETSIKASQKGKKIPEQIRKNIRKQAEETLKRERNMLLAAEKEGIKTNEQDVDKRLSQIKTMLNKQGKDGFDEMLKRQEKTEEQFKEMLEKQMIFEELRKKLSKEIKVSDKELKEFYKKNKNYFTDPKNKKKVRSFNDVKGLIRQMIVAQEVNKKISSQINKQK